MAVGRRPKPVSLVKGHRTKAEKSIRETFEKKLTTGQSFKEWPEVKNNTISHKEFLRLKKALSAIDKDDVLHEGVINRYCLLSAEINYFTEYKLKIEHDIEDLYDNKSELDYSLFIKMKSELNRQLLDCDKKIMEKRKMQLEIEKENIMTISGILRSIPKKPADLEENDPMAALLGKRGGK